MSLLASICSCSTHSFIRLADYLIVNTMHVLAVNSVSTLLNYLTEQLQNTPTLAQIQGLEDENKDEKVEEDKDKVTIETTAQFDQLSQNNERKVLIGQNQLDFF